MKVTRVNGALLCLPLRNADKLKHLSYLDAAKELARCMHEVSMFKTHTKRVACFHTQWFPHGHGRTVTSYMFPLVRSYLFPLQSKYNLLRNTIHQLGLEKTVQLFHETSQIQEEGGIVSCEGKK